MSCDFINDMGYMEGYISNCHEYFQFLLITLILVGLVRLWDVGVISSSRKRKGEIVTDVLANLSAEFWPLPEYFNKKTIRYVILSLVLSSFFQRFFAKGYVLQLGILTTLLIAKSLGGGKIGQTLAWSYYLGYLKPGFKKIDSSQKSSRTLTIDGFYILLPKDGKVNPTVTDVDQRITFSGFTAEREENVAGTVGRIYRHSVYKVKNNKNDNGEEFHAIIEYPPAVTVMKELLDYGSPYKLSYPADFDRELGQFHRELQRILDTYYQSSSDGKDTDNGRYHQLPKVAHLVEIPVGERDIVSLINNKRHGKRIEIVVEKENKPIRFPSESDECQSKLVG